MNIQNDNVILTAEDFDGLSELAKKSLSLHLGDYAANISDVINAKIILAKENWKNSTLAAITSADAVTLGSAESLLAQLDSLLNP